MPRSKRAQFKKNVFSGIHHLADVARRNSESQVKELECLTLADFGLKSEGWILVTLTEVISEDKVIVKVNEYLLEASLENAYSDFRDNELVLHNNGLFLYCENGMPKEIGMQFIISRFRINRNTKYEKIENRVVTFKPEDVKGYA